MSAWSLLFVPGTLLVLFGLLMLTVMAERRILSPRALILQVSRARMAGPDHIETVVAREYERLLRDYQRS